jgi:hypothetical protein
MSKSDRINKIYRIYRINEGVLRAKLAREQRESIAATLAKVANSLGKAEFWA